MTVKFKFLFFFLVFGVILGLYRITVSQTSLELAKFSLNYSLVRPYFSKVTKSGTNRKRTTLVLK